MKPVRMAFLCIILLLIFLMMPVAIYSRERIVLASMEGLSSKIGIKIITEAYQQIGIEVDVRVVPSERALRIANMGLVDGLATRIWAVGELYLNLVRVPVPVKKLKGVVFTKDLRFEVRNWESLRPYKIGILIGSKFAQIGTEGMKTQQVATYEMLFRILKKGRVDVVVAELSNALGFLHKMKLADEIIPLDPSVMETNLYHYVHHKNADLVPAFTKALLELKTAGRDFEIYNEIMSELSK